MCYTFKLLAGLIFCLFTCISVFPQASLVKDINSTTGSVQPSGDYSPFFFRCGNYLYFKVSDETGSELWRTDGTTAGTLRVSDLNKGFPDGVPTTDFECLSGLLIYAGNNGESGTEIYKTNGQVGIVQRIKDIRPGVDSSSPHNFVAFGSKVYFFIPSANPSRQELWETNGTDAGTQFITEIPTPNSTRILSTASGPNYFFFTCITDDGNSSDIQLWRSDGTSAGTIMLKGGTFFISRPVLVSNQLYFSSYDVNGYQLWKTDGTLAGTIMVKDVGFNDLYHLFAFNDKLIFSSGNSIWISDGTGPGTISLATGNVTAGVVYSNLFYGVGSDFSAGNNFLLRTNGLVGNTEKIVDLGGVTGDVAMYGEIPVLADQFILPLYTNEQGQEIGISNRLQAGTFQLKDIQSGVIGSEPRSWSVLNSKVIFLANDGVHGTELWVSNGTFGGTTLLKDCRTGTEDATSASIANIEVLNDQLYFLASSSSLEYNTDLWKSDGTDAGTVPYFDFDASPLFIGRRNDELYYLSNYKLYKTSGLAGGTSVVKDLSSEVGGYSFINHERIVLGNKLIFYFNTFSGPADFGGEYWVTDGTSAGTKILKDIYAGSNTSINTPAGAILNTSYIFAADNGSAGEELWITDGTEAGTVLLKDINSGAGSSTPSLFTKLNTKILFTADDGINGKELWETDGTNAGTKLLVNLSKGSDSTRITSLCTVGNTTYFATFSDSLKWALWKTDGTINGTTPFKYFDTDVYHAPTNFTASNGKLFFAAHDALRGNEVWVSDGTSDGTVAIDIVPGATGSNPSMFTTVEGITYFRANGELWKTNGTAQHTQKVSTLDPLSITVHQGWIYFMASSSLSGAELYKIQHTGLTQTITFQAIPVKVLGDDPFLVEATSNSGLPVSLTTTSTKITLTANQVTLVSAGSVTIKANQSGDISFAEAAEVTRTFCINPPKPVLTISGSSMAPLLTSSSNEGNTWFRNGTLITGATGKTLTAEETGIYTVQTTVDNCISLLSDPQEVTVVGIEDPENQLIIYPNPATETLRIEVKGFSSQGIIQVLDMTGRIVHHYDVVGETKLDHKISGYPPALYLVKVVYKDKVRMQKFVKR